MKMLRSETGVAMLSQIVGFKSSPPAYGYTQFLLKFPLTLQGGTGAIVTKKPKGIESGGGRARLSIVSISTVIGLIFAALTLVFGGVYTGVYLPLDKRIDASDKRLGELETKLTGRLDTLGGRLDAVE